MSDDDIIKQLQKHFSLPKALELDLRTAREEGLQAYNALHVSRLRQAFMCFTPRMKEAFYDTLFFLHVNDPVYAQHTFETENLGIAKAKKRTGHTCDLYVENAPSGLARLNAMPVDILTGLLEHVRENFTKTMENRPDGIFTSVASLGSIGTVAHKKEKSDLDLQIQYDLAPIFMEHKSISNNHLKKYFKQLIQNHKEQNEQRQEQEIDERALKRVFPQLYNCLFLYDAARVQAYITKFEQVRALVEEISLFLQIYERRLGRQKRALEERRIKQKTDKILRYLRIKYPEVDIHFFTYSTENYRLGNHGSGLDSKESSGSAYEHILNYETLMPGIQFLSLIPFHHVLPDEINRSAKAYKFIRTAYSLGLLNTIYNGAFYVDLGPTLPLTADYMDRHYSAVYWEAFKGTSGNLPKSFLNLLRLENLYYAKERHSVIELIKNPSLLPLPALEVGVEDDEFGLQYDETKSLSLVELQVLERNNPEVRFDPWWLRYKALKVFFLQSPEAAISDEEKEALLLLIDTCFALHIWIYEVFEMQNQSINYSSVRDIFLLEYFEAAFPPLSQKRSRLRQIFLGEIHVVSEFEVELRCAFRDSVDRILKKINTATNTVIPTEHKIWLHYYKTYFMPKEKMVVRSALSYLNRQTGRPQIVEEKDSTGAPLWKFRAITQESKKRFNLYEDEGGKSSNNVLVYESADLLHGIVYCVANHLFGLGSGGIKMTKSQFEFVPIVQDSITRDEALQLAPIKSEILDYMADFIVQSLPRISVDYRDCVRKQSEIRDLCCILNLGKFGRVNFVTRDVLDNLKCNQLDILSIQRKASLFYANPKGLLASDELHSHIFQYIELIGANLGGEHPQLERLHFWVNPLSFQFLSLHSMTEKIDFFSSLLRENFINFYEKKMQKTGE